MGHPLGNRPLLIQEVFTYSQAESALSTGRDVAVIEFEDSSYAFDENTALEMAHKIRYCHILTRSREIVEKIPGEINWIQIYPIRSAGTFCLLAHGLDANNVMDILESIFGEIQADRPVLPAKAQA